MLEGTFRSQTTGITDPVTHCGTSRITTMSALKASQPVMFLAGFN